ncbi:hypothetical protein [Chitinophaga sp.]|uniref:hypothetical protein n=1 Tax=Chitinophaga sp. TaxID=1869181 RepID=UPI0031D5AF4E
MKKSYLTLAFTATMLTLCASPLLAQEAPKEKKFFVGTGFNFSSQKSQNFIWDGSGIPTGRIERNTSTWGISPQFGWFLRPNFAIGVEASYYSSTTLEEDKPFKAWSAGPFVRYIIPLWKTRLGVFNDAVIRYGGSKNYVFNANHFYLSKMRTAEVAYRPGLQFGLRHNINLLASLGPLLSYTYSEHKQHILDVPGIAETKSTTHNVGISNTFDFDNLTIGVNFLF